MPNPANPQSLNRYSYVLNNPLRYTDPTGHSPDDDLYWQGRGYENENGQWVKKDKYNAVVTTPEEAVAAAGDADYVLIMVGGVGTQGYEPMLGDLAAATARESRFSNGNFAAFHLKYNAGQPGDSDIAPSGEGYSGARARG